MTKILHLLPAPLLALGLAACTTNTVTRTTGGPGEGGGTPGSEATGTASGTPISSAGCPAGSPELVMNGVEREIGTNGVALRSEAFQGVLLYPVDLSKDTSIRNDVARGIWDRWVAPTFTPTGDLVDGGIGTRDRWLHGPVVDASGNAAYVGVASGVFPGANGIAMPTIAITADQATFTRLFPDFDAQDALHRYNDFPLACADLAGTWSTSSSVGVVYGSGAVDAVASSLRLALAADGTFTSDWSAYVDGRQTRGSDRGTFSVGPRELALRGDAEQDVYDARFVAVQGGFVLDLMNRARPGVRYTLARE